MTLERLVRVLAVAWLAVAAPPARGGDLVGEVRLAGPPPLLPPRVVNKNIEECGKTVADQSVLGTEGHLENVVVMVKGEGVALPPPKAAKVVLNQKLCHYVPHVQAVPLGSTLEILNSDTFLHNIHGRVGASTAFNLAMPIKGMKIPRVLAKPEVLHVLCDVHSFMEAWVVVVEGPAAVSGTDGRFDIRGLPAGTYTVTAWHERFGTRTATISVPASGEARVDFSFGG